MKKKIFFLLAALFTAPLCASAEEAPPQVLISEVNWAGSTLSAADEWLELQNLEGEAIDLTGWSIEGAATSGGTLFLPDGAVMEPNSIYLISNYAADASTLSIESTFTTTNISLGNSGLALVLRDGSGTEINRAGDGGSPPAGFSGAGELGGPASMIRVDGGWMTAETSLNFDVDVVQFGTPGIADVAIEIPTPPEPAPEEPVPNPLIGELAPDPVIQELVPQIGEPITEPTEPEIIEISPEVPPTEPEPVVELVPEPPAPEPLPQPVPEPVTTYAPGDLLIHEVMSDPDTGPEWVEITNPGASAIELEGWSVREGAGTSSALLGTIDPGGFARAEFSNRLNNDGDHIDLIDPSGQVIDAHDYGDSVEIPLTETTPEPSVDATEPEETVEEPVEIEAPVEIVKTLRVKEMLPNPEGDEAIGEYIIIENFGADPIMLDGWELADETRAYALAGELDALTSLTLSRSLTNLALNNTSAETVTLTSPEGDVIDTVTYERAEEGVVYARDDAGWNWEGVSASAESEIIPDTQPEPNVVGSNTSKTTHPDPKPSVARASGRSVASSTQTHEGVVVALPGTFGSQVMYIDGLQIYQYYGDFPALAIGDVVRATGTPSSNHGEPRLKISSASSLSIIGTQEVAPLLATLSELDGQTGKLIQVAGLVLERSEDRFILEENGVELEVVLKEGSGIAASSVEPGQHLTVTGVLSVYDGKWKLLPRSTDDLVFETTEAVAGATVEEHHGIGAAAWGTLLASATAAAVAGRWWFVRKQKRTIGRPSLAPAI